MAFSENVKGAEKESEGRAKVSEYYGSTPCEIDNYVNDRGSDGGHEHGNDGSESKENAYQELEGTETSGQSGQQSEPSYRAAGEFSPDEEERDPVGIEYRFPTGSRGE